MRSDVLLQVARRLESLVAIFFDALVRFFPGVHPSVALEPVSGGEGLVAALLSALERPVAGVGSLVHLNGRIIT